MHTGPDFSVTRRPAGDAVVVVPEGEIDLATIDQLRAEIDAAAEEASLVVIDLRAVTFIDSAGIRLIIEGTRALADAGGEFAVVRGSGEVRRIFGLVGLDGRVRMLDRPPDE
jgi:anti-sigma B factor antagonist